MRKVFFGATFAVVIIGIIFPYVNSLPVFAQTPAPIPPVSCSTVKASEPHPLRPYPGETCGPESTRTIDQTDKPYCAQRPWAAKDITYMKNMEDCRFFTMFSSSYPCLLREFYGMYEIDLTQYELPLVSITRDGSDLTYFNRAQEHIADYLEGRAYYDRVVEPIFSTATPAERASLWNRVGILRKLTPLSQLDDLKIQNIQRAGRSIHNYIVGYRRGSNPSPWGTGSPVRMSQFIGHYPPEYTCGPITDLDQKEICIRQYQQQREAWEQTIYGKLWPYVPMFTREDAIGFVQINPEPNQWFRVGRKGEVSMANRVFLPHLPRLNQVSARLQQMLSSRVRETVPTEETEANMGIKCPAGAWSSETSYYNACERGELCNFGQTFYSPGDYALDSTLEFLAKHTFADPINPKIIPQTYYEEYKDFVCQASGGCLTGVTSTTYCASGDVDGSEPSAIRKCPLPYCTLSSCRAGGFGGDGNYCVIGAVRYCDLYGWSRCSGGSWIPIGIGYNDGACTGEPPYVMKRCSGGQEGVPDSGTWVEVPGASEQGRCEEMLTPLKIAFTPGYIRTYTPYLRSVWENTVHQAQAIFTPFRTALKKAIYDWPGESLISYDYPDQYAEAGAPPGTTPGNMAKIYFRYLGYIHCAKENLLNKLSPFLYEIPYVYYDARCNAKLW